MEPSDRLAQRDPSPPFAQPSPLQPHLQLHPEPAERVTKQEYERVVALYDASLTTIGQLSRQHEKLRQMYDAEHARRLGERMRRIRTEHKLADAEERCDELENTAGEYRDHLLEREAYGAVIELLRLSLQNFREAVQRVHDSIDSLTPSDPPGAPADRGPEPEHKT